MVNALVRKNALIHIEVKEKFKLIQKKKKTICFLNTCATLIDLTSFTAIAGLTPLRFVRFAFLNIILKTSTLFLRSNKNIYIFCCFQKKKKVFGLIHFKISSQKNKSKKTCLLNKNYFYGNK